MLSIATAHPPCWPSQIGDVVSSGRPGSVRASRPSRVHAPPFDAPVCCPADLLVRGRPAARSTPGSDGHLALRLSRFPSGPPGLAAPEQSRTSSTKNARRSGPTGSPKCTLSSRRGLPSTAAARRTSRGGAMRSSASRRRSTGASSTSRGTSRGLLASMRCERRSRGQRSNSLAGSSSCPRRRTRRRSTTRSATSSGQCVGRSSPTTSSATSTLKKPPGTSRPSAAWSTPVAIATLGPDVRSPAAATPSARHSCRTGGSTSTKRGRRRSTRSWRRGGTSSRQGMCGFPTGSSSSPLPRRSGRASSSRQRRRGPSGASTSLAGPLSSTRQVLLSVRPDCSPAAAPDVRISACAQIHPPWSAYTAAVERAIASAKSRNPERADKLVELHETLLSGWAQTRWLAKMDEQGREELLREVVAGLPSLLNRPGGDFDLSAWKSIFPPTPAEARKKAQAAANNRDYMERKRQAKALGVPFVPKKAGRPSEAPRRDAAAAVEEAYYLGRNASQPGPQYHPGSRADQPPISAPLRTTGTRARREDRHLAHGGPPVNPSGTATSEAGFSNPSLLALTPETPLSAAPAPPPGYVPAPAFPPRHGRPTDGSLSERFSGLSHGSPPPDLGPVAAFLAGRDGREGA
ncbi:hypothetical protein DMC30DRAFT_149109 [Rhodotorula diobovata]|uniref:Uncharacterized protein n=1 Tax=Rhodotorula diobovata TaxID=5288 RepID=A0A5C5FZU0_9BASI|nr:hypothetical protein DMC30DRAFT_149109 [Rhodotorula diobovata]